MEIQRILRNSFAYATIKSMQNKRLYPILLIIFTNIFGAGLVLPILPIYATNQFGATVPQATYLASAFFAAQAIAAPILGQLSDRFGRRPLLIISQAGTVVSFLLFIFAAQLGELIDSAFSIGMSGGLVMLFVARTLDGITGGNITIAQAYISDVTTDEERTSALGLLQAAFGAGFIFGPALGGQFRLLGVTAPFIAAAVITTITLLLTFFMLSESLPPEARGTQEERDHDRVPARELLRMPGFGLLLTVAFLASLAFSSIPPTFSLYAEAVLYPTLDEARVVGNVGLMMGFLGIVTVLVQAFVLRPMVKRFGERTLIVIGQIVMIGVFLSLALTVNPWLATLAMAPLAFSRGINDPSAQSVATRFGSARTRGQLLGLYQSAVSMGLILGPIWAGQVFELISPRAMWFVGAGILLFAAAAALRLRSIDMTSAQQMTGVRPSPVSPE